MVTKAQVEVPAGVVTVLLGDVEGSVRHWEADAGAMAKAMARLDAILDDAIPAHRGVRPLEQGEGDSFVAAFATPADAVSCTLAIQSALAGSELRVRMAVHTDEAIVRGTSNYSGAVVNRAARLRALAHGGQVLVSGATRELVAPQLPTDAGFVDLGVHTLRDVPAPVHVWQLSHPNLAAEFPPLRSPDALATNLPTQLTTFIGRVDELRATRKLLFENRLVSLTGAGGTGKTRLALELALDAFEAYRDGVWFVDLTPVGDPSDVATTIATTLHLGDAAGWSVLDVVAAHFADDRVLLVIDNCEHVVGAVASFVDGLLRRCANVDVVVTSREPLNIGGEASYAVPPMALPDAEAEGAALAYNDAVELLVDRVQRADPAFELSATTAPVLAEICRRVDGLPLAIELAAARARTMSLDAIGATLRNRFDLLSGGARTAPARQRSVVESVAWSYELLDEGECVLLRRLSVFEASFAVDTAEFVCAGGAVAATSVLPTLLSLADKSLVRVAGDRYSLLATVREFARDRLVESNDDEHELRQRHLDFLVDLAVRSADGLSGPEYPRWLARLRAEEPNIDVALGWAAGHDRLSGLRLATALSTYAMRTVNLLRGWRRVEPFLDVVNADTDPKVAADAGFAVALVLLFCGEMSLVMQGPVYMMDALARYEQIGDDVGAARARGLNALMSVMVYPTKAAQEQCEASIAELSALGDDVWSVTLLACMGGRHVQVGRGRAALPYLEQARAITERMHNGWLSTMVDTWRAGAFGILGRHREAMALAEHALVKLRVTHDPDHGSFMNFVIGDAQYHLGDLAAAEHHAHIAASMGERHNIRMHAALGYTLLGKIHLEQRRPDLARHDFERAFQMDDAPPFVARHASGLAGALIELGELDEARKLIERGLAAARQGSASSDLARLLLLSASVAERGGDDATAEDLTHQCLAVSVEVGTPSLAAPALEHLAAIAARQESDVEAVRLFSAAATIREGLERRPGDPSVLDPSRTRLADAAFETAWAEGAAMSLDDAAAYASRGRGERKRPSTGWGSLTPTETEVVRLVTEGLTNPQIGDRLFIARGTVRTHLSHIFTKLGVTSRAQLASEATRRGFNEAEVKDRQSERGGS